MRTIEEIKDKVAQDNEYKNWEDVHTFDKAVLVNDCMKEAQKEAQKEAVNELFIMHQEFNGLDEELVNDFLTEIENQ